MKHFADTFGKPAGGDWTPDELLEHETSTRLPVLDESVAIELGQILLEKAAADGMEVAMEVHLRGRLVFRAALPGSDSENDRYLAGKLHAVNETGHASLHGSKVYRDGLAASGATDTRVPESGPFGGGFPLRTLDGEVAGVALVSGLPEEDDHAMIVWAIGRLRAQRGEGA
jgi:uncharacterized protein (UPF0303 family)